MKSMGGHTKYVHVMLATDKSLYLDNGNLYCDIYIFMLYHQKESFRP